MQLQGLYRASSRCRQRNACSCKSEDADPDIIKGIELISNQLAKSFEKLKIESYGKAGDAFDPNLHNAVSKIEDENLGADTIAAVYQTGYKIGDKIIRHAMVQVANCD
mgnify:CR=1 FL=1